MFGIFGINRSIKNVHHTYTIHDRFLISVNMKLFLFKLFEQQFLF